MKIDEEEKEILTDKRKNEDNDTATGSITEKKKKKTKKHKKRRRKSQDGNQNEEESKDNTEAKQKSLINSDQFNINNRYHLIKMLGFGSFGEIHLAYDSQTRQLNAIKFELITQKNPQLKHEFNILEQLNKNEGNMHIEGIPKVFLFDRVENKANFMIMEFLGPALSDLFQFKNKQFSLTTVLLLGIQMLQRIEFIHEKGFIHRDIKPENFVVGLNDKSNTVYTIDYGLSKRYKDKNTGQHIPYRENRHLIGTARYASLNAHLGIEQSRRDDIESIGYVLVYFLAGRLPWQSKQEKAKLPQKIMEKKMITPPEILCKKLPSNFKINFKCIFFNSSYFLKLNYIFLSFFLFTFKLFFFSFIKMIVEFSYYFHYCKNLKFEDRPDYSTLKSLFYDLLISQVNITNTTEFIFDWLYDETPFNEARNEDDNMQNQTFAGLFKTNKQSTFAPNEKLIFVGDNSQNESQIIEPTPSNFILFFYL